MPGPGWRLEKTRDPREWREGSSFYCFASSSLSTPFPSCVSCTKSTVSPILMYLLPEVARWLFIGPVLPPFISHYETSSLESSPWKTPRPTGPLASSATALVLPCSRWYRSGVRSSKWGRSFRFSAIGLVGVHPGVKIKKKGRRRRIAKIGLFYTWIYLYIETFGIYLGFYGCVGSSNGFFCAIYNRQNWCTIKRESTRMILSH